MIGGTAEVVAKRVDAGRIGEMTTALRHEGASDEEMTADPVRATSVVTNQTVVAVEIAAVAMVLDEDMVAHGVLNGRSAHGKTIERHVKSARLANHAMRPSVGLRKFAHVVAGQLVLVSIPPKGKNTSISGLMRARFEKKQSRQFSEPSLRGQTISNSMVMFEIASTPQPRRRSEQRNFASSCSEHLSHSNVSDTPRLVESAINWLVS